MRLKIIAGVFLCVLVLASKSLVSAQSISNTEIYCNYDLDVLNLNKSENVTKLQKFLKSVGIYKYKVNGVYDKNTKLALQKYQKTYKIKNLEGLTEETLQQISKKYCTKFQDPILKIASTTATSESDFNKKILKDVKVEYVGNRIIKVSGSKMCKLKNSTIDWGNGTKELFYNRDDNYECTDDYVILYPDYGKYKITIINSGKITYEIPVDIKKGVSDWVSISKFKLTKEGDKFLVITDTDNALRCSISGDSLTTPVEVDLKSPTRIQLQENKKYTLDCVDKSERHAYAYAVSGDEIKNTDYMIKQLNYVTYKGRNYIFWETTNNVKVCNLAELKDIPRSGVAELLIQYTYSVKLECYGKNDSEEKYIRYDSTRRNSLAEILSLNYKKIGEYDYVIDWSVKNAVSCTMSGANIDSRFTTLIVNSTSGTKTVNIYGGKKSITLSCNNADYNQVSKEIILGN